jgi:hypothetical protein
VKESKSVPLDNSSVGDADRERRVGGTRSEITFNGTATDRGTPCRVVQGSSSATGVIRTASTPIAVKTVTNLPNLVTLSLLDVVQHVYVAIKERCSSPSCLLKITRNCGLPGASDLPAGDAAVYTEELTYLGTAVPSRLEKAISELQGLNELLLSGDLDPRVLANFRDALNRVRTAAWAAQQCAARKETAEGHECLDGAATRYRQQTWMTMTASAEIKR